MDEIVIANERLQLRFNPETGALCGVEVVETGWCPLNRSELGLSFQLLMPLPGRRNNPVLSERQRLASISVDEAGQTATLTWDGVESLHGGRHDVRVRERVQLEGARAVFELSIENGSDLPVESVHFPYLGDVRPPALDQPFSAFMQWYCTAHEWPIWPRYQNLSGYWGVDRPTQYGGALECGTPMAPFILLRSPDQGLYVGVDQANAEFVAWHTELHPGHRDAIDQRAPDGTHIGGKSVAVRFAAVHMPYIQPGDTRTLTPIALEPYRGGWQQGADRYRAWSHTWMKIARRPAWVEQPHSWLQIQMNSPEDELRFSFRELVDVGRECAEHGVRAIQLVGWNHGGQDQNNPSHDPDPRLGTPHDLCAAIEQVQGLGVRVVLFSKFTWADRATERFRTDLIRLAVKDPYGDYYMHSGYRYNTPAQLLDINPKRLIPMCFMAEEYLQVCEAEFANVLELRPDGILYDECQHHSPALLCFDCNHGHRLGALVYANDRELVRRLARMADAAGIDFLFAGEGCYDWELEVYHLAYHRSWNLEHIPLTRYLHPALPVMTAITGFDDRNMVNQCLLYRYVMSYEPYHFKGRLSDFPLTIDYGKRMDALRMELRDHLWDGEFRHEVGAKVTCQGKPHHPYALFVAADGTSCLAIANYDEQRSAKVDAHLENGRELTRWRLVEDDKWRAANAGITIPPRSAAVVMER
ncbi:MAG: DUF6259 domain-containing protein [Candidatus Dormibacteraceae bacterium]